MKKLYIYFIALFLISCSGNHYHDGKYKTGVFTNASLTWVNNEVLEFDGSEMNVKTLSVIDGKILAEFKTTCTQYKDRIEFKGEEGVTHIARIDNDGNIQYGEYTYKRINDDKTIIEESESKNENGDGKKDNRSNGKTKQESQHKSNLVGKVKTYSDEDISYQYVETVKPDVNEKFFQGTRNFDGHFDDLFRITIKGNKIRITDTQSMDEVALDGFIKEGEIFDTEGNSSRFIYIKPTLYYKNKNKEWYVFREYN